ncbi:MAG: polysaccharide deacetylase family protein [Candidatus Omnitrophota bacterium]
MKKRNKILIFGVLAVFLAAAVRMFLASIYVPPILMYHSIDGNEEMSKLSLCPVGFARQMEFFHKHGYNVISLGEMVDLIKKGRRIPPKTVTITFDDGFRNNYLCAYPVLKRYGFPATIFVITGHIGSKDYLTWDDIKELQDNNITIGSHTKSHLWLVGMSDEKLRDEIFGSKEVLEKGTGRKIDFFSYPIGAYDERVQAVVKDAGYKAACATNPGPHKRWDDIYALKRVRISRTANNMFVLWIETSGYYTFIKEVRDEE